MGERLDDLLEREDLSVQPGESYDVPGDTARQQHQMPLRPFGERYLPRQVEQCLLLGRRGPDAKLHARHPAPSGPTVAGDAGLRIRRAAALQS